MQKWFFMNGNSSLASVGCLKWCMFSRTVNLCLRKLLLSWMDRHDCSRIDHLYANSLLKMPSCYIVLQAKEEKLQDWEERLYLVNFRGSCMFAEMILDTFGEKQIFRGLRDWLYVFTGLSWPTISFRIFRFFNCDKSAGSRINNPILDFIKETHPQATFTLRYVFYWGWWVAVF